MNTAEFSVAAGRAWSVVAARLPLRFDTPAGPAVLDLAAAEAPADWHRIDLHVSGLAAGMAVRPDLLPPAAAQWPEATEAALPGALHEVLLEILFDDVAGLLHGWRGERPLWAPAAVGALPHHLAITCAGRPRRCSSTMPAWPGWPGTLQDQPALWLDVEAVPVACELLLAAGGVRRRAAGLADIATAGAGAGQVLDLGLDASPSVSLRVNGQVVATGELVKLGDRSGIRLTAVHLVRSLARS